MAFKDFSTNNFQLTAFGNAKISTSVKKYGDGSAYFDGAGDYVQAIIPNWNPGVGGEPFTIEFWAYILSTSGLFVLISKHGGDPFWGPSNGLNFNFYFNNNGTDLRFDFASGPVSIGNTVSLQTNQWTHFAIVYDGSVTSIFVDGTKLTNTSSASYSTVTNANKFEIGSQGGGTEYPFNGYIDDLRITKGVARYTSNFTPPQQQLPTTADPYFSNVSLLLPMNLGPFKDSSTNNFQLSAAGNADLSTVVKKYGTASVYFDGSGDYLSIQTNEAFNFGTGDFTVEFWTYLLSYGGGAAGGQFFGTTNGSQSGWSFNLGESVDRLRLISNLSGSWADNLVVNSGTGPLLNQWSHIALVRSGNTIRIFVNGQIAAQDTGFSSYNFANNDIIIGRFNDGSNIIDLNGYIDDLRITKGIARYTSNFTPPQQQLPDPSDPYQDNVSLLLHMDQNQFVDASYNNFTITPFGNVRSSTQVIKYGDTAAYFDGNSVLKLPINNSLSLGAGDFTVELWVYPVATVGQYGHFVSWRGPAGNGDAVDHGSFSYDAVNKKVIWYTNTFIVQSSNNSIPFDTWTHVSLVRSGSDLKIYINGVNDGSADIGSQSYDYIVYGVTVGSLPNIQESYKGYIDDLRITKGVARYTSNFTPPSAQLPTIEDPNFNNVSLLLQTNRPFTDSSTNNFELTAFGNAQISTSVKKFGNGAGYFDGNGDYLEIASNDAFNFGTGDFTIEAWIYLNSTSSDYFITSSNGSGGLMFGFQNNTNLGWGRSAVAWDYSAPSSITTGQWYHVAISRSGTSMRLFVNGSQIGTTQTNSTSYNLGTDNLAIGAQANNYFLNGYIDDLRITKGVARYTSNFVPHTAPFANPVPPPIPSGYLAFWKLDNLTDSSPNGNVLTNNGNVQFVQGKIGDCAEFASSKYLSTSINWNVVQNDWSVSFWMFPTSTPANVNTFPLVADNLAGTWLIQYLPSLGIGFNYVASPPLLGSAPLNTWTHVAATKSSAGLKLYINGILQGTSTYIGTINPTIFRMNTQFNDQVYTGKLDAVGIWQRELTQSEINILYNNGNGREP